MTNIEAIILLLLLFMAVPDLCTKLGRPALAYSMFVVFGLLLGLLVDKGVKSMLTEAGQVGFLLLLFDVGSEIDLPAPRYLWRPARHATLLAVAQYPLVLAVATLAGLNLTEAFLATAALTGCSVGMAHAAWKAHPFGTENIRVFALRVMVLLEVQAVVLLSLETVVIEKGVTWLLPLKITGISLAVLLVARFASHLKQAFQQVLEKTTRWRIHFLVLLILVVCAVGERLGLSGPKTAFVLGLFIGRAEHDGKSIEEYMAPITHRFLIPIFFVALGLEVPWQMLLTWTALLAVGTAGLLLAVRELLHRRWLRSGGDRNTYLLFCPNLTIVALAASALLEHRPDSEAAVWLLFTGLFLTTGAILMLPTGNEDKMES